MPILLAGGLCHSQDVSEITALTVRIPIRINCNADFTSANGVTGGSGNESSPWLIEGWDIGGAGFSHCIYVGNTTQQFIVNNCSVQNASGTFVSNYYTESGIILYNVSGGALQDNIVATNDFDGICLYNSTGCTISGNNVIGNEYGITIMDGSNNNSISGNSVTGNAYYGVNLMQSDNNVVSANNVSDNGGNGICISECEGNNLVNNHIWGNENGIDVWDSGNNTIFVNWLCGNYNGIYLEYATDCALANNNASGNENYGIQMVTSSGNSAYHNRIWNNSFAQAGDSIGGNSWDSVYPSGGNNWCDYFGADSDADGIGDLPYLNITGDMGARDRYPLMQTWFPDTILPVASAGQDIAVNEDSATMLNGTGSFDNVGIVNFTWRFNNGLEEVSFYRKSPTYNFTQPGIFSVMLDVEDSAGNSASDEVIVSVRDVTPPTADAGPDWTVSEGANITFNGSASVDNVAIADLLWTFNDGIGDFAQHGTSVSHVFTIPGSYTITLNATDAEGLWAVDSAQVTVSPDSTAPVVDAGADQSACVGVPIQFNGSGSFDNVAISNYTWNFTYNGSIQKLYGPGPSFVFWASGNYTVTLSVNDLAGNSANDLIMVSISKSATDPNETNSTEEPGLADSEQFSSIYLLAIVLVAALIILTGFIIWRKNKSQ